MKTMATTINTPIAPTQAPAAKISSIIAHPEKVVSTKTIKMKLVNLLSIEFLM